jgi:hypothetical protein
MKHIQTFESFTNEATRYYDYTVIAAQLVEIAASYTDVDLTSEMDQAAKCINPIKVTDFYEDLLVVLTDEDIAPNEVKNFQKECISFLKKAGITVR